MRRSLPLALWVALTLSSQAEVRLAGGPITRIAIGANATNVERFAAEELQSYFAQITGDPPLPIEVVADSSSGTIRLGQAADQALGDDGYRIQTSGGALLLTGPHPRSTLFAAYHLLESCGVRFLGYRWRGGEIVPRRKTLEIPPLSITEKPAMKYRFVSDNNFSASDREKLLNVADWAAKNRCNVFTITPSRAGETWEQIALDEVRNRGLMIAGPGHALSQFTPDASLFATHPEYFPMRDGQRVAKTSAEWGGVTSFCLATALPLVVDHAVAYLQRHPFIDFFALYPPDGSQRGAQCQCPECAKLTASDAYLTLMNAVAREMEAKRCTAKLMWIAYNECGVPPQSVRPEAGGKNLVLLWCNDLRDFRAPMDSEANRHPAPYLEWKPRLKSIKTDWKKSPGDLELAAWHRWKAWSAFLKASDYRGEIVLLDYFNAHVSNSLRVPSLGFCQSGPWPPGVMEKDFQFYRAEGIAGWQNCTDYYNDFPNPYWNRLTAELLWNPSADVAAIDHDFYEQLYGPAAAEMQAYFPVLWTAIARLETAADLLPQLAQIEAPLLRAERMSVPREIAERIKFTRAFHERCAEQARR